MRHPFDGLATPAPAPGRRSFIGLLMLAAATVLGLRPAARAQTPPRQGPPLPGRRPLTTFALGEEGGLPPRRPWPPGGRRPTTLAIGEEGGRRPTTFALGEEGGRW